jgi:hypothetical protein
VTTTETRQEAELGIHAVYPVIGIDIHEIRGYFAAFASLWDACDRVIRTHYLHLGDKVTVKVHGGVTSRSVEVGTEPRLSVRRLTIGSPMVAVFVTYLFARILRNPKRVGAWLPEVVASWHETMRKAADQKAARQLAAQFADVRAMIDLSNELVKLRLEAEEVRTVGVHELPDDLTYLDAP